MKYNSHSFAKYLCSLDMVWSYTPNFKGFMFDKFWGFQLA